MTLRSYIASNYDNMNTKIFLKIFNEFSKHSDREIDMNLPLVENIQKADPGQKTWLLTPWSKGCQNLIQLQVKDGNAHCKNSLWLQISKNKVDINQDYRNKKKAEETFEWNINLALLNFKLGKQVGSKIVYKWTFTEDDSFKGLGDDYQEICSNDKSS